MPNLLLEYEISKQQYREYLEKVDYLQRDQYARTRRMEAQYRLLMEGVEVLAAFSRRVLAIMKVGHKDEYQTNYQQR